jgi:hypothetical protein
MKRKRTWMIRGALLTVVMCVLLCLGMGAAKAPEGIPASLLPPELPPGYRRLFEAAPGEEQAIVRAHLHIDSHMVDTSLEIREQWDFRLTPALLVQEAISDGVILTYPEE